MNIIKKKIPAIFLLMTFFCLCLSLLLNSCISSEAIYQERLAKSSYSGIRPPQSKALLYLVRERGAGGSWGHFAISVDGTTWGTMIPGDYLVAALDPGRHLLTSKHRGGICRDQAIEITLSSGQTYYYRVRCAGLLAGEAGFNLISEAEGIRRINNSRLSKNNRLAYTLSKEGHAKAESSPTYSPPATSETRKKLRSNFSRLQQWAVIIGISRYEYSGRNNLTNLIFADDDAKAFERVLLNLGWSQSHMRLLVNKEATQRNIVIALESWLTKAGPRDQIVLFWSGHGFPDPEDPEKVYFACYDTNLSIPATGYRMDRVRAALEERRTRNVVVFADTCHAGKLITRGKRGISIIPKIDQMRREDRIPKGWIFMVGADTDRNAIEHTSWTNGAFTHCLLKALHGKADGFLSSGANDGIITMGELRTYMNTVMPDETQKVIGVAKRPVITTSTGDPDIWNLTLQAR